MPVIFPPPIFMPRSFGPMVGNMVHAQKKTAAIIKRAARKAINRKKHKAHAI